MNGGNPYGSGKNGGGGPAPGEVGNGGKGKGNAPGGKPLPGRHPGGGGMGGNPIGGPWIGNLGKGPNGGGPSGACFGLSRFLGFLPRFGAFMRCNGRGGMRLYGRSAETLGLVETTGNTGGSLRTRRGGGFFDVRLP